MTYVGQSSLGRSPTCARETEPATRLRDVRRGVRRAHQAAGHRAAAADHGAGDVLRRRRGPAARPGRRHRRRRHAVGRVGVAPSTASTTATSTSRCAAPAAGRCRGTSSRRASALVFGLVLGVVSTVILGALGQPAVGGAGAGGQRVLRLRLHDAAQAPDHPEHRLGRPRRLLPGPDRLDRGHRRARLGAGRAVPGGVLLDPAAHLGAGAALPRGLRERRRADAAGRGRRPRGRPADRASTAG